MEKNRQIFNVRLDADDLKLLKLVEDKTEMTRADIVREAVKAYLMTLKTDDLDQIRVVKRTILCETIIVKTSIEHQ